MPDVERDLTVNWPGVDELDRLRAAFSATATAASEEPETDAGRIWRAVRGELSPGEVEDLADRAGRCPETAAAWRLAVELSRTLDETGHGTVTKISDRRPRRWIVSTAAAALVVVGIGAVLYRSFVPAPSPVLRSTTDVVIDNEVASKGALPRDDFVLRWTAAGEGSIYEIVITDASLSVLDEAAFLEYNEYRVPATALADLDDGSEVWWRVEATMSDGSRVVSSTFVTPVR